MDIPSYIAICTHIHTGMYSLYINTLIFTHAPLWPRPRRWPRPPRSPPEHKSRRTERPIWRCGRKHGGCAPEVRCVGAAACCEEEEEEGAAAAAGGEDAGGGDGGGRLQLQEAAGAVRDAGARGGAAGCPPLWARRRSQPAPAPLRALRPA